MSEITLRIDKGKSSTFVEIMNLAQCFSDIRECKKHYSVKVSDVEACQFSDRLQKIIELLPSLQEKEWFNIPDYGSDAWANWMIDLHNSNKHNNPKK